MRSTHNSLNYERGTWLEDCIGIVREAALGRRAVSARCMPDAIEQAALDLGLAPTRAKALFYREVLSVSLDQWAALKRAAIRECDERARALEERMELLRARRAQHEMDLGKCGQSGGDGRDSLRCAGKAA